MKVRGERAYEQWPHDATLREMQQWQEEMRAELLVATKGRPAAGSFESDARKYLRLPSVRAMPTYAERVQHIEEWIAVLGSRRRRSVTPPLIEAQRDAWLADGYAGASVNKRMRALSNLWTKLDGRRAPNPVSEVAECAESQPIARGLPYDVIEAILAAIPDTYVGKTKDGTLTKGKGLPRPSRTKARLRVMAYTGLAPAQVALLQRSDVDLEAATVRVVARRKGKRVHRAQDRALPELLPLIPQAVDAFREFDRLNCWSTLREDGTPRKASNSSIWKAFQRACEKLGLEGLKPYDFRHSFLSMVYQETRDLRVTGKFGGHRSERTTRRYTMAAVAPHVREAAEKVRARLAPHTPGGE